MREASGDFEGAVADYGKALEADPQLAEAYAGRGLLRHARGQDAEARKGFDSYLELNKEQKDSLEQRIRYVKYQRAKKRS